MMMTMPFVLMAAAPPEVAPLGQGQDSLLIVLLIAGVILTLAIGAFFAYAITREEQRDDE